MTTNNAPGLYPDSGEFVPAAELNTKPVPTSATGGDWMQPTTIAQRLGDAVQLLCGGKRPANDVIEGWLNTDLDDCRLQDFCATHGPAWAQGIALIDLAMVAVEQPTEGVEHEMVKAPTVAQMEAIAEVIEELENDGNGWCAKVRWLYNPIPTGELLYWPQPATAAQAPVDAQQQGGA